MINTRKVDCSTLNHFVSAEFCLEGVLKRVILHVIHELFVFCSLQGKPSRRTFSLISSIVRPPQSNNGVKITLLHNGGADN